jgi:hydrogenase/urease accessory protein HupE
VLGYVPSAAWFIPAVELLIALSIVYAGVVVLVKTATGPSPSLVVVTTAFGLLHGFGFSFVLSNILKIDQPHLWTSLISFNIGVEIGQLTIVLLVWPLLYLLSRYSQKLGRYSRLAVVIPCIAVAALWSGERLGTLLQEFVL